MGLGHSSVESAIMFPWYHGYQMYKDLPEDDRIAIQQIYGSREKMWGDNPRPRIPTTAKPTTTVTPRSYYPDRNPTDQDRDERERQERERDRQRLERERERQHQEWERRQREQREKERRRQKEREQREREERERKRQNAWERDEHERNERRHYDIRPQIPPTRTTTTTTITPNKSWHHHNNHHHQKFNKNNNHPKKEKPETCNTSYDAITIIRNELFIFKDRVSNKMTNYISEVLL